MALPALGLPKKLWLKGVLGGLCLFSIALLVATYTTSHCSFRVSGGLSCGSTEAPAVHRIALHGSATSDVHSGGCNGGGKGHLRTKSPPLDFQWLALHESATNVELLGPDGSAILLEKMGTILLLNNTAYKFEPQQSGVHKLMVSSEIVSEFALHPADCFCPTGFTQFLDRYQCSPEMGERVRKSMARWRPGTISPEMLTTGVGPDLQNEHFIQFAIFENKLYCKLEDGQRCPPPTEGFWYVGLAPQIRMIQAVLHKVTLPDMVFFWNQEDNPTVEHYGFKPVFSPSSAEWFGDLLFPVFNMINDKFEGEDVALAAAAKPWEARRAVAYFAGRVTGQPHMHAQGTHLVNPRLRTAEIAIERPDLLDVNVVVSEDQVLENLYTSSLVARGVIKVGQRDNQRGFAKYVLDLPGNSAAWRLGSRFGDGAVTIKSRTPWNEFWHYLLEDRKNVLFVEDWPDELVQTIEAAKVRDAEMRCIAREAQLTALTRLRQEEILCWAALNLQHLSTKYSFTPNLTEKWYEIPVQRRDPDQCTCTDSM